MADSGWVPATEEDRYRTGVNIGSGIGGLSSHRRHRRRTAREGTAPGGGPVLHHLRPDQSRLGPGLDPPRLQGVRTTRLSRRAPPAPTPWATPCASSSTVTPTSWWRGERRRRSARSASPASSPAAPLSTHFNDAPAKGSRPYDKDRDGFVMGEGAGALVLEELEHAKARGAQDLCRGRRLRPRRRRFPYHRAGRRRRRRLSRHEGRRLAKAGVDPSDIDYINAHGTSTPLGDEIELGAVERLFGQAAGKLAMSSTKSAIGHLLGAAGRCGGGLLRSSPFATRSPRRRSTSTTPRSRRRSTSSPNVTAKPMKIEMAMSNSFGFGGTNASVVFKRYA